MEDYNPRTKRKVFIVFDDLITDMISIRKLRPIVTDLFIRDWKLNISLVLIKLSYFKEFIFKREIQQVAIDNSPDIDF